jgi:hypothetical protein
VKQDVVARSYFAMTLYDPSISLPTAGSGASPA